MRRQARAGAVARPLLAVPRGPCPPGCWCGASGAATPVWGASIGARRFIRARDDVPWIGAQRLECGRETAHRPVRRKAANFFSPACAALPQEVWDAVRQEPLRRG